MDNIQTKKKISIGKSDFVSVIKGNLYYVDKTLLIKEILDRSSEATLFTRPRRFGKTMNMSMLKAFFEINPETEGLFDNLAIWKCGDRYRKHQGKYPVVYLSFADFSCRTWQDALEQMKITISEEYLRHKELFVSDLFIKAEVGYMEKIADRTAGTIEFQSSIKILTRYLKSYFGTKPIVLMDEYDTPLEQAQAHGYYKEMITFMRGLFSGGFKDNPYLEFGVITGVLRISKEAIFTGMNNFDVNTIFDAPYSNAFGFTRPEVEALAEYYGISEKMEELKEWYDGYCFGGTEIYNPWSIMNYCRNGGIARAYWARTSGNQIIHRMIRNSKAEVIEGLRKLMAGLEIHARIATNVVYPDIELNSDTLYATLLMTGYLKPVIWEEKEDFDSEESGYECILQIPNKEVRNVYRKEIFSFLDDIHGGAVRKDIGQAIRTNDVQKMKEELGKYLMQSASTFDTGAELFYQGLLLGICYMFEEYYITSNRESGEGRYDIQLEPENTGYLGIIMELKSVHEDFKSEEKLNQRLKAEAEHALNQVIKNKYIADLKMKGIQKILIYGISFKGKKVEIESRIIK